MRYLTWGCVALAAFAFAGGAVAQQKGYGAPQPSYGTGSNPSSHGVGGYTNPSTGGYVQPHQQTNPNSSRTDNYGAPGNYNPNKPWK